MNKASTLSLTESQHQQLMSHLFPSDGFEAAAILLCNKAGKENFRLVVEKIIFVPYSECGIRTINSLSWPGEYLEQAIDESIEADKSIVLIHSHPGGYPDFSELDDSSDKITIPSLQHGANSLEIPHGSAIILPTGIIKGRIYDRNLNKMELSKVLIVGENIRDLSINAQTNILPFTSQMTNQLSSITACVVGASGTGSITAELLARLGVGHLILIDFDRVEYKNLNRILYATEDDAKNNVFKTTVLKRAIISHHPNTKVTTIEKFISDPEAIISASDAEFIFSCVDSIEGRYYCDLMAQAFISPLIDLGVTIPTRKTQTGNVAIADVLGRIDYVFPDGPSLFDKGVISAEALHSEYLYNVDKENYDKQVKDGYIKGQIEEAPSVISLNMRAASAAVNEWLSRLYVIRDSDNRYFSQTIFSLTESEEEHLPTNSFNASKIDLLGWGLREPLLNLPQFCKKDEAA